MDLLVAGVGPLIGAVEAVAASIGSGVVIGGFFGGIEGGLSPGPRKGLERKAAIGSYVGGFGSLVALTIDILGKYFV